MDFIGDIVEREVGEPVAPTFPTSKAAGGFPKAKKISAFKLKKKQANNDPPTGLNSSAALDPKQPKPLKRLSDEHKKLNYKNLTEAEKIHLENMEILNNMSEEDKMREKEELLNSVDPQVLKALLLRSENKLKRAGTGNKTQYEGYGEWIGGGRNGEEWPRLDDSVVDQALGIKQLSIRDDEREDDDVIHKKEHSKTVRFEGDSKIEIETFTEDVEYLDELAPPSYQINKEVSEQPFSSVHFTKPVVNEDEYKLDLNDPDFQDKLHEKYFPDLPKDTEKLKWMEPLPEVDLSNLVFNDVSDLRFDFNGDLIVPASNESISTYQGLHHHSSDPSLAGYTLTELAHLSRSTVPSQRSIAIRTIGRILHKLGKGSYKIEPEFEDQDGNPAEATTEAVEKANTEFEQKFWGLIDELRIIETLKQFADENLTSNISVRNYAIEALWLWQSAGGNRRHAN